MSVTLVRAADAATAEAARGGILTPIPLVEGRPHARWEQVAKRALDLLVAIPAAVVLLLIAVPVGILIRLDSPGPIFFGTKRYGLGGRTITIYKFRSMEQDAEARLEDARHLSTTEGPSFKAPDDPRITRVGRWLRRSSIDELPQVLCVLRGDMSIVGPRPVQWLDFRGYEDALAIRNEVKPGMTGLWQVSGRSNLPFMEMARLDLLYTRRWSIWMDLMIIARTVPAVLLGRGAM